MVRVRLFGELQLERDGQALPGPSSRRGRVLLAWLALHPGTHSRSELAARMRPEVLDASARLSLRQAAWDVRRAIGPASDRLLAGRDRIGLVPGEGLTIDVWDFQRLLDEGDVDDALALWRQGELLEGLDDDWVFEARDRERERLAVALAAAARREESDGELERALSLTRTWAELEPLTEAAGRELIRRLAAAGDDAAAVATFERLGERLRRKLGVAPSRQTRALVEEVWRRAGSPPGQVFEQGEPAVPEPAAGRHPLPSPVAPLPTQQDLVGRESELEQLLDRWTAAAAETAACVLVAGDAGIGKTRLLAELCRVVHAQGAIVLFGRGEAEALTSYQPFVEALRRWATAASGNAVRIHASAAGADVLSLLPELRAYLPEPATPPDSADRLRMFDAVAALLSSIAGEQPLLLALDDAHDADRPSLLLLRHIVRGRPRAPLLVAVTYRHTDLTPQQPLAELLGELRREELVTELQLEALDREAEQALVTHQLGAPAPALATMIHERARGNPFFATELARTLAASGVARRREGRWDYDLAVAEKAIPTGVHDLIDARVGRLSEAAHRTLRVAAVLGEEFELDVLARVHESDEDLLLEALDEARAAHFLIEVGQPGHYRFAHPLVRETLYERLSATRRARLHARAGDAIEELRGPHVAPAALALHFGRAAGAARREKAIEYAAAAAEDAMSRLAYEDALAYWDQALPLVPEHEEERRRALLRRRGITYAAHAAWLLHADLAPRLARIEHPGATSDPA